DAVRLKPAAHKLIELLGHHVEGDVAADERIEHDDVVRLRIPVQEYAAVALDEAQPARLAQPEVFLRHADDDGIDVDGVYLRVGQKAMEIDGYGAAAETQHEHAFWLRRIDRRDAHRATVEHRQVVGIGKVGLRFAREPALHLERQSENVLVFADED